MLRTKRVWLGLSITAAFLALLVIRIDFAEMAQALREANYILLIPAIAVYFFSFYLRALRWRYILRPVASTIRVNRLFPVILVGYMANNMLPVRLGEVVRGYYLSTREQVRTPTALATIVTERVFDGTTLLLLLAVAVPFLPFSGLLDFVSEQLNLPHLVITLGVALPYAAALGMIALIARAPDLSRRLVWALSGRLPERIGAVVYTLLDRAIAGFEAMRRPSRLLGLLAFSVPVWLTEALVYYLVAVGLGLDTEFSSLVQVMAAIFLVMALSNLATSLPSSQGGVGPFEFFTVLMLEGLGVGVGLASAYALVLHLTQLLPPIAAGLVYFAVRGLSFQQIVGGSRQRMANPASANE